MSIEEVGLVANTEKEFLSWFPEIDPRIFRNIGDIEEIKFTMKEDGSPRHFIYRKEEE